MHADCARSITLSFGNEQPSATVLQEKLGLDHPNYRLKCRSVQNGHAAWWYASDLAELADVIKCFFYRDGGNKHVPVSRTAMVQLA